MAANSLATANTRTPALPTATRTVVSCERTACQSIRSERARVPAEAASDLASPFATSSIALPLHRDQSQYTVDRRQGTCTQSAKMRTRRAAAAAASAHRAHWHWRSHSPISTAHCLATTLKWHVVRPTHKTAKRSLAIDEPSAAAYDGESAP